MSIQRKKKKQFIILTVVVLALLTTVCVFGYSRSKTAGESSKSLDYSNASNWAYYEDTQDKDADVFLVCPTVDLGKDGNMNMSMDDDAMLTSFKGALNMERGIYDECGNMFAPYYRQVTFPVYSLPAEEAAGYYEIAYGDVKAAFEYFLAHTDEDRPIIMAGFSQGSEMMLKLMKDYFKDENLQSRLVAAYAIGWRITQKDLDTYPWLKMAQEETDTGVIVSFNSETDGVSDSMLVPKGCFTYSINPLNWKTDSTAADTSLNLGACFTNYDAEIVQEIPGLCGAVINPERGTLIVTGVSPEQYPGKLFPDGIYHLYDYQFFYRNLQENVSVRLAAWEQ